MYIFRSKRLYKDLPIRFIHWAFNGLWTFQFSSHQRELYILLSVTDPERYDPDISWFCFLSSIWPGPGLRNYPIRFGWKLVQLRPSLVSDRFVKVKDESPTTMEHLHAMLGALDWTNVWEDADMRPVCHYLRGSKSLELPDSIKGLLPWQIWKWDVKQHHQTYSMRSSLP